MKQTYKLERTTTYDDSEQYTDFKIWTTNDPETWPMVLKNMVLWLSSIYGYEILKHIKIMGEPLNEVAIEDSLLRVDNFYDEYRGPHHCGQDCAEARQESFGDAQ